VSKAVYCRVLSQTHKLPRRDLILGSYARQLGTKSLWPDCPAAVRYSQVELRKSFCSQRELYQTVTIIIIMPRSVLSMQLL